uniref:Uncharacterized protein n=1 Tax=Octopus bimaculoides TaxID=37653 RepID=A0A0L8FFD0_OCTBM
MIFYTCHRSMIFLLSHSEFHHKNQLVHLYFNLNWFLTEFIFHNFTSPTNSSLVLVFFEVYLELYFHKV